MIVACPKCNTKYRFEIDALTEEIFFFRCNNCQQQLKIDKKRLAQRDEEKIEQGEHHDPDGSADTEQSLDSVQRVETPHDPITVKSPVFKMPVQGEKSTDDASSRYNIRKKVILVADDSTTICVLVEELLTDAGFIVITANDGQEAYEKITHQDPDLVVLDLLMPKMTGFDVLKKVRAENNNVPVLVMTAIYKKASQVVAVKEMGADGYIEKPFTPDHLLFRVNALIEKAKATAQAEPEQKE